MRGFLRFVVLVGLIYGINGALIYGVRKASQSPVPPSYISAPSEACALPCWQNIRPGRQRTAQFWMVLSELQAEGAWMLDGRASSVDGDILSEFRLTIQPSPQIRLGDLLFLYGAPQFVRVAQAGTLARVPSPRQPFKEIYLYWAGGHVQAIATIADLNKNSHVTPDMYIRDLRMSDPQGEPIHPPTPFEWQGFANMVSYE